MKKRNSLSQRLLASAFILASSILSTSCNLYTTDLTGRYIEITTNTDNSQPVYSLDLFRYGRFVQAVLRFTQTSNISKNNVKQEEHCIWTKPNQLNKNTFHLSFESQNHQGTIDGRFEDGKILLTIKKDSAPNKPIHRVLEKSDQIPEQKCISDRHIPIAVDLSAVLSTEKNLEISPHVETQFTVIWVGSKKNFNGEVTRLENKVQLSEPNIDVAFDETEESQSFNENPIRMYWPAPINPSTYTQNGSTSFTIGYPVVIQYNLRRENDAPKILASTLFWQKKAPNVPFPHTGYGRAILYVDGNLKSLAPSTKARISLLDNNGQRIPVENAPNPNSHMYVCDIYFQEDTITHIDILNAPLSRMFSMHKEEEKRSIYDFEKAPRLF